MGKGQQVRLPWQYGGGLRMTMLDRQLGGGQGHRLPARKVILSQAPPPSSLAAQVARLWSAPVEHPSALILLATPGRDPGELRDIAQSLGLRYVRLDLGQTVTPEQHALLTDKAPRIVALFGMDRLAAGERDSLVRLLRNGPRTLPVSICPIAAEKEGAIRHAWGELRAFDKACADRAKWSQGVGGG